MRCGHEGLRTAFDKSVKKVILSEEVTFELSTERQEVSMWSLGEESSGREGSIHWTRRGFKLIHRPSAFGLKSVKRPVFPNKLSKWKV